MWPWGSWTGRDPWDRGLWPGVLALSGAVGTQWGQGWCGKAPGWGEVEISGETSCFGGRKVSACLASPRDPGQPRGWGTLGHCRDPGQLLPRAKRPSLAVPAVSQHLKATAGSAISAGAVLALATAVRVPVTLAVPKDGQGPPGTLGDVAPCHCHPAPSWKELPAGTKQDSGTPLPRGPQGPLPSSPHQPHPGAAGVPLSPTLPPAQLRQFRAANMWLAGLLGAIRAVGGGRSRRGVAEQMSWPSTGDTVQH